MRANNVLGVIHAQAYDSILRELTAIRTTGSVPFGSRYRLIDFPLSCMVNAGMTQVGIMTTDNYQSLMDHLGSGKPWDLARKNDGMFLLPPHSESTGLAAPNSRIGTLSNNLHFLQRAPQDYVLMVDANAVYNVDFNDLFDFHEKVGADITVVYKHGPAPSVKDTLALDIDKADNHIKSASIATAGEEVDYSFNMYLLRKKLLIAMIEDALAHKCASFEDYVITGKLDSFAVAGYELTGYAEIIDSLPKYYEVNTNLLNAEVRNDVFSTPIYTKIADNVPVSYGPDCQVSNSLIADGCNIEGIVENSILFRGVKVEPGAAVRNSIVMQGTTICSGASLHAVIADKNVTITRNKNLSGDPSYPLYITKRKTV